MKTNAAATNATMSATAASVQKDATGTNSGLTDVWLKTILAANAKNVVINLSSYYLCGASDFEFVASLFI